MLLLLLLYTLPRVRYLLCFLSITLQGRPSSLLDRRENRSSQRWSVLFWRWSHMKMAFLLPSFSSWWSSSAVAHHCQACETEQKGIAIVPFSKWCARLLVEFTRYSILKLVKCKGLFQRKTSLLPVWLNYVCHNIT